MRASNKQTSECGRDRNSTEELIKQLENRLNRLTGQPAEEMNVEEIENILNLLDTLKPLPGGKAFNPEEAFERLERDYLDNPEKLEQASEEADRAELKAALREKAVDAADSAERKTASGKHQRFRVLKNIGIAAAIMILVFSGLNLATYATARKGLFDLIINRKNTMSNMYVGEGDMGMGYEVHDKEVYTSWDEVPDEAKKGILLPEYLPEGMELEKIKVFGNHPQRVELQYGNYSNSNQYIQVSVRQFEDEKVKDEITNPQAEYIGTETVNTVEYHIYKFEKENLIFFVVGDNIYYVYSTLPIEELKEIAVSF